MNCKTMIGLEQALAFSVIQMVMDLWKLLAVGAPNDDDSGELNAYKNSELFPRRMGGDMAQHSFRAKWTSQLEYGYKRLELRLAVSTIDDIERRWHP